MWDINCAWMVVRLMVSTVIIFSLLAMLGFLLQNLLEGEIQFEYEINLPRSKRNTLNKLYSKMGEAAMKGDEKEEKRIWEVIQRMETHDSE